jgi:hypothetical protein
MTAQRQRDPSRLLSAVALQADARLIGIEPTNGGHLRAIFAKGGTNVCAIIANSPSDHRDRQNTRADVRRTLRRIA